MCLQHCSLGIQNYFCWAIAQDSLFVVSLTELTIMNCLFQPREEEANVGNFPRILQLRVKKDLIFKDHSRTTCLEFASYHHSFFWTKKWLLKAIYLWSWFWLMFYLPERSYKNKKKEEKNVCLSICCLEISGTTVTISLKFCIGSKVFWNNLVHFQDRLPYKIYR